MEYRDAKITTKKHGAKNDEQPRPDRRIHFEVAEAEPLFAMNPQRHGPCGLVGINDHIEVKSEGAKAEDRAKRFAGPVAERDECPKHQDLHHRFDYLAVIDGPDPGDETQQDRQARVWP